MSGTVLPIGFCVDCYDAYRDDVTQNGSSSINYFFDSETTGSHLKDMSDLGTPHMLSVRMFWDPNAVID